MRICVETCKTVWGSARLSCCFSAESACHFLTMFAGDHVSSVLVFKSCQRGRFSRKQAHAVLFELPFAPKMQYLCLSFSLQSFHVQHVSCVVATGAVFLGFVSQLIRHPYNVPTVCGAVFTHHTLARRLLERNISCQSRGHCVPSWQA